MMEYHVCPKCGKKEPIHEDKIGNKWHYECGCISAEKLKKVK